MNLGENIYRYRTQMHMSQGDLADALDISRQSVSKWENNSAVPELDKLMKMAQLFGITLDELVTGMQKEPPASIQAEQSRVINENDPAAAFLSIPLFLIGILIFVFLPGHILSWLVGLPLLLSGLFVVYIGMDAYFKGKRKEPNPISTPPAAVEAAAPHLSMQRIWGIVLLAAAFCLCLIISLLGGILNGLIFASPLYVPGLICLFSKKHTGLKCTWAEFVLIVTYFMFASGIHFYSFRAYLRLFVLGHWQDSFNIMLPIISFIEWILLVCLIIWTVYSYRLEAHPLGKRNILPVCLGAAAYCLPSLVPLTSDSIPYILLRILHACGTWLNVALLTLFLVHLWPTLRNWWKHKKDKKHSAAPKTEG